MLRAQEHDKLVLTWSNAMGSRPIHAAKGNNGSSSTGTRSPNQFGDDRIGICE